MAHLVPGVEFDFGGGKVYTLAPLPLIAVKRLQAGIGRLQMDTALSDSSMSTIQEVLHISLLRNYPEMTREQSDELLDVSNMLEVVASALDVGGFKRKAQVEAKNLQAQLLMTTPSAGPLS